MPYTIDASWTVFSYFILQISRHELQDIDPTFEKFNENGPPKTAENITWNTVEFPYLINLYDILTSI